MSIVIADHDIILRLDGGAGTGNRTLTNTGNQGSGGNYVLDSSLTEGSDFSWVANADSVLSYLSLNDSNAHFNFADTTATGPGTTVETINFSCKFRIAALTGGPVVLFSNSATNTISCYCDTPAVAGDFDIRIGVTDNFARTAGYLWTSTTFGSNLTFGTDYILSWTHDMTTPSAAFIRTKLNGVSATGSAVDHSSATFTSDWPRLGSSTSNYMPKRHYYLVYQRGDGTSGPWTASDMDAIYADPSILWTAPVVIAPQANPTAKAGMSLAVATASYR